MGKTRKHAISDLKKKRWADLVRKVRGELGETQIQFAARFGLSYQAVQQWESQGNLPSDTLSLVEMAKLTGQTAEQLSKYLETGEQQESEEFDVAKFAAQLRKQNLSVVAEVFQAASSILANKVAS
jgi:transcriptional regulator with XRE-family HTH domain